jgi:hypothetical protein
MVLDCANVVGGGQRIVGVGKVVNRVDGPCPSRRRFV